MVTKKSTKTSTGKSRGRSSPAKSAKKKPKPSAGKASNKGAASKKKPVKKAAAAKKAVPVVSRSQVKRIAVQKSKSQESPAAEPVAASQEPVAAAPAAVTFPEGLPNGLTVEDLTEAVCKLHRLPYLTAENKLDAFDPTDGDEGTMKPVYTLYYPRTDSGYNTLTLDAETDYDARYEAAGLVLGFTPAKDRNEHLEKAGKLLPIFWS